MIFVLLCELHIKYSIWNQFDENKNYGSLSVMSHFSNDLLIMYIFINVRYTKNNMVTHIH